MTRQMRVRVCAAVVALTLALGAGGPSVAAQGRRESITVHGQWSITVRNADGSIASVTRFENALMPGGMTFLARLLGKQDSLDDRTWLVHLDGTVNHYNIHEGTLTPSLKRPWDFDHLAVSVTGTPIPFQLQLVGSAKALADESIAIVRSALEKDMNGRPSESGFTSHTLTTPIPVVTGQTIDVTVVISFS